MRRKTVYGCSWELGTFPRIRNFRPAESHRIFLRQLNLVQRVDERQLYTPPICLPVDGHWTDLW